MIAGRTPLQPEEARPMNPPRWDDLDYIHFLIAAQKVFTGTEAARCAPEGERAPAHDAFTRLLPRQPPDTEALGQEAKAFVDVGKGLLVLDDTTLDKPDAQKMDRVTDY
jgi:putative transposase